ncbi:PadR family transcriptional regulator [Metallosphaera tengchongensis]|uniref:PadR family transcriptional regulator n=1 Tax=Metallosphaera tengchongensis TaxID=1532350 RepID=A0A6N0NSE9_9CREN|nr:PadR family transcriptional regulator [Metallosphaera tengchongensis]QKQ99016.1 PadR family transcriptional regulator [Metallosphaera tengchongensis]
MSYHWHKRRGLSNLILTVLEKRSHMTGAQIIREIEKITQGLWRPSPGAVYPALDKMESEGLIKVAKVEGAQKFYEITDEGRKLLTPLGSVEVSLKDLEYNVRFILDNWDILTPDLKERLRQIHRELGERL